jgi:hypothetical protein
MSLDHAHLFVFKEERVMRAGGHERVKRVRPKFFFLRLRFLQPSTFPFPAFNFLWRCAPPLWLARAWNPAWAVVRRLPFRKGYANGIVVRKRSG